MTRLLTLALLLALTNMANAQDRAGRDTPGEWRVTHQERFGLWDSFCDERKTGDQLEERCYIRFVDVFSPHPEFGAVFLFITPEGGGDRVEFGFERGTRFADGGFHVAGDADSTWQITRDTCLRGRECVFEGVDARDLLDRFDKGDGLILRFTDRHGADQDRYWDLGRFSAIYADYRNEATKRELLP